ARAVLRWIQPGSRANAEEPVVGSAMVRSATPPLPARDERADRDEADHPASCREPGRASGSPIESAREERAQHAMLRVFRADVLRSNLAGTNPPRRQTRSPVARKRKRAQTMYRCAPAGPGRLFPLQISRP